MAASYHALYNRTTSKSPSLSHPPHHMNYPVPQRQSTERDTSSVADETTTNVVMTEASPSTGQDEEDGNDNEKDGKPDGLAPLTTTQDSINQDIDKDISMIDAEQWAGPSNGVQDTINETATTGGAIEAGKPRSRPRATSSASASSGSAVSEFDVPDDDDDYAALENVSACSDDGLLEREESIFIRDALEGDNAWATELFNYEEAIDWTDASTYHETPSGLYDEILESHSMQNSPLSHIDSAPIAFLNEHHLTTFGDKEIDPHLSHGLFRTFSLTSDSSSSASSSDEPTLTPEETLNNPSDGIFGDSHDSDTEVEDMSEEIAQRAEKIEERKKAERRRKKAKKGKSRSKSLDSSQSALVLKKFPVHSKRPLAYTVTTPRGSVMRFTMPKNGKAKFRWVTGRTRPNPFELSPMPPAYASAMQGRLFQLYHCPNSPNLAPRRRQTTGGEFGSNLSFSNSGPLAVQRSFTASGGLSEAFFVNLGDASDDGDSYCIMDLVNLDAASESGEETESTPTPLTTRSASAMGCIHELDDEEAGFHAAALSSPARCHSPVNTDPPSSVMQMSPGTKRRLSDTSDGLVELDGPTTKRPYFQPPAGVPA